MSQSRVFAATIFLGAFLLFLIQPLMAKQLLPLLGGSPAVWKTCMVFFQVLLFFGYVYAHLLATSLSPKFQSRLHVLLLALGALALPPVVRLLDGDSPWEQPAIWVIGKLVAVIGVPYFLLAASSPLLQKWFSGTAAARDRDPYVLFAASNAGSLAGLLGYPLFLEPWLKVSQQVWFWSLGYLGYLALVVWCARDPLSPPTNSVPSVLSVDNSALTNSVSSVPSVDNSALNNSVSSMSVVGRAKWVLYSFLPSSLLLSVTHFITEDLAPIPLLWIIPLGIYLGTFMIVFARLRAIPLDVILLGVFALVVHFIPLLHFEAAYPLWLVVMLHLAVFSGFTLLFHAALAEEKPAPEYLTEFYFWISLGGMLGGLFNGLAAPFLFNTLMEYPLTLALCGFFLPIRWLKNLVRSRLALVAYCSLGLNVLLVLFWYRVFDVWKNPAWGFSGMLLLVGLYVWGFYSPHWFRFAAGVAFGFIALSQQGSEGALLVKRGFFGALQVVENRKSEYRLLYHGTTNHGGQRLASGSADKPFFYYYPESPIGQLFQELEKHPPASAVAIVGLGAGGLAPYARAGQVFRFYEIDPLVASIARNPELFTYLSGCRGRAEVVVGDGRIELAKAADHSFGLIILDAYSSDAVPVHLLTKEALEMYLRKLTKNGILAFHISNRYLALELVLGNLARHLKLHALAQLYDPDETKPRRKADLPFVYNSRWVIMTRYKYHFGDLPNNDAWRAVREKPGTGIWTDDFSNVLSIYNWK